MSISIPGADYTPQLSGYTGQGAFRFWCQKVLPIVYDDSLSYYELLNKVVAYLNNVIADVASVEDNVGQLNESYGLLQAYVNEHMQEIVGVVNQYTEFTDNYFDNLDVQEEINTKLDEMASDGSLSTLIGPIVVATAPDVITQWLSDHITPTTPIVDNTLTISGAAADAKVTGDNIIELKNTFTNSDNLIYDAVGNKSVLNLNSGEDVPGWCHTSTNTLFAENDNPTERYSVFFPFAVAPFKHYDVKAVFSYVQGEGVVNLPTLRIYASDKTTILLEIETPSAVYDFVPTASNYYFRVYVPNLTTITISDVYISPAVGNLSNKIQSALGDFNVTALAYPVLTELSTAIGTDGGKRAVSDSWRISGFIAVSEGQVVCVDSVVSGSNMLAIAGYSAESYSNFVSGVAGEDSANRKRYTYIVPADVNYIVLTAKSGELFSCYIQSKESEINKLQNADKEITSSLLSIDGEIDVINSRYLDVSYIGDVISDYSDEMMAQCPSVLYMDNGYLYIAYYGRATHKQESPHPDVKVKLIKTNPCNPGSDDREIITVMSSGDVVGDFTQSPTYAPYDPQLINVSGDLWCIFVGCANDPSIPPTDYSSDSHETQLVRRYIVKDTMELGAHIRPLTLSYEYNGDTFTIPIKRTEMGIFVNRRMGRPEGTSYFGRPALSAIREYNGYFYAYLGGEVYGSTGKVGKGYCGTLIRSLDGLAWEEVSTPVGYETDYGLIDIFECSIGISDGIVYCAYRASLPTGGNIHGKSCLLLGRYDLANDTWGTPIELFPWFYDGSRNAVYIRSEYEKINGSYTAKEYLYVLGTVGPSLWTQAGYADRENMAVVKFNIDGATPVQIYTKYIKSIFGLTYPDIVRAGPGEYMVCAENRRWDYAAKTGQTSTDPTYPCSDIACKQITFFDPLYTLNT